MKNSATSDMYYVKALDYYPYGLEFVLENLNYALGYDDEHGPANCLMGMVYMYQIKIYREAAYYFDRAIEADMEYPEPYKHYSLLKIWLSDYDQAQKLIQFGLRVKGVDKSCLLGHSAMISEIKFDFKASKVYLDKALDYSYCQKSRLLYEEEIKRIRSKIKKLKKRRKKINCQ